jgi:phospholipid/cholesterol/gamma-HCH transport system permease protein
MATREGPPNTPPKVVGEAVEALEEVGEFSGRLARNVVLGTLAYFGEALRLLSQSFGAMRRGIHLGDLVRQTSFIGVESLPIVLLTALSSGGVLALYTVNTLTDYGAGGLVGGVIALSVVRETGPLITAITVVARAGSAITAEIASMKATEQLDALRSLAVSPVDYLVVPRLLASLVMLPVLALFADVAGIVGGGIVASSKGVGVRAYTDSFKLLMEPDGRDIFEGLFKALIFGLIMATIACREGLQSKGGAAGVGQATNRSVVLAIVLVYFADLILTWMLRPIQL